MGQKPFFGWRVVGAAFVAERVSMGAIDREDRSIGLESAHIFTKSFVIRGQ